MDHLLHVDLERPPPPHSNLSDVSLWPNSLAIPHGMAGFQIAQAAVEWSGVSGPLRIHHRTILPAGTKYEKPASTYLCRKEGLFC